MSICLSAARIFRLHMTQCGTVRLFYNRRCREYSSIIITVIPLGCYKDEIEKFYVDGTIAEAHLTLLESNSMVGKGYGVR